MAVRADKLKEQRPSRTIRGYAGVELWEVWDEDANGNPNQNAAIDVNTVLATAGLPQIGDNSGPGNSMVVDATVVHVVAPWSVIVQITYRGYGLYTGGPRNTVSAFSIDRKIDLPVWRKVTVPFVSYSYAPIEITRPTGVRVYTKFRGGSEAESIADLIAANVGNIYPINGLLYYLSAQSQVRYDGTTNTRVDYVFERPQQLDGYAVNHPELGNAILIPNLAALYFWSSNPSPDPNNPFADPTITTVHPPVGFGAALPGF